VGQKGTFSSTLFPQWSQMIISLTETSLEGDIYLHN
jgi:hypothetical protein